MTNEDAAKIIDSMLIPVACIGPKCDIYTVEEYREAKWKAFDALMYMDHMQKQHDCNDCALGKDCAMVPRPGMQTRINCYHWEGK